MNTQDADQEPGPDRASLRAWEAGLDKGTRARGATYAAEGRVKVLLSSPDTITGIVAETDVMPYRTTLKLNGRSGLWAANCDCPVGISCKHAVALALTVLGGPADEQAEAPSPAPAISGRRDFVQAACEALGRNLTRKETLALTNIAAAASPSRDGRPVRVAIEAALHAIIGNDYAALHRLPAELEASAHDPDVLLAAIAAALESMGKPCPAWLNALVHSSGAADTLEKEQRDRLVRDWKTTLGGLGLKEARTEGTRPMKEIRLRRTGPWIFQWETRENPAAVWRSPSTGERQEMLKATFDPELSFTRDAARVVDLFQRFARSATPEGAFDIRQLPGSGKAAGELFKHPKMREIVVEAGGEPVLHHENRLVWAFSPAPGKAGNARPFLAEETGAPAPSPIHPLGAALYLAEDGIWPGPPPLGGYDGRGAPPNIPVAVFEDPAVRAALLETGAILPSTFESTLVRVTPAVRVTLKAVDESKDLRIATTTLSGTDSSGRIRAELTDGVWRTLPVAGEPPTAVPDTDGLDAALRQFFKGPRFDGADGACLLLDSNIPGFAEWLSGFPKGTRMDLPPELAALVRPPDRAVLAAEIREGAEGADWFDMKLVLRAEDTELTKADLKLLLAHQGRWVRVPGKGWRRMETDVSEASRSALASLGLDPDRVALGDNFGFHASQLSGERAAALFDPVSALKLRECVGRLAGRTPPELPSGLRATLRPYQTDGFRFLAHLAENGLGGVLADDMGLGKTLQTLAWILWLGQNRGDNPVSPVLVVAPKSVVRNWAAEAAKFAPALKVALHGEDSVKVCAKAGLVITNYARLRLATDDFMATEWTAVILDEGQHIKNPSSQIADTVRSLKARHRLILSGTPVENRLLDLWSLFSFAMPGLLGTQAAFKRHYDEKRDKTAPSRLAARIRPFLLRRTKAQVAPDLPERIEEDLVIELEPKQRKLYDAELKKVRAMLVDARTSRDFDKSRFNILASLLRLRQICCDPRLVSPKAKAEDSAKMDALLELLGPLVAEGHKVLVFSQFTGVLELISERLKQEALPHLILTGATENRAELVDRFQEPDSEKIFLLSLKAAGTGLNLTAASYVVLFDPWWNPAAEAQAIDRTHRIGQKNRVIAYRLIARGTVEEKIRALQRNKAALAGEILREESLADVLDIEALRSILAE